MLDHRFKRRSAGAGHSETLLLITHIPNRWWEGTRPSCCAGQSPWAVGSPAEPVAHGQEGIFFIKLFHGQQRTVHLSLTQPLSETQGAALGLNPFKSFTASNVKQPCPSRAPAWDAAGHAPPHQLSGSGHLPARAALP